MMSSKGQRACAAPDEAQAAAPDAPHLTNDHRVTNPAPDQDGDISHLNGKKKRNTNPGVRVQGGRIYDSENGTSCHQCRQKTVEVKAKCTSCTLFWCPRCLLNRYGEEVEAVNLLEKWSCPRCKKLCNCSNCRKGLTATGILANVSKAAGFQSVSALLEKNPNASRPAMSASAAATAAVSATLDPCIDTASAPAPAPPAPIIRDAATQPVSKAAGKKSKQRAVEGADVAAKQHATGDSAFPAVPAPAPAVQEPVKKKEKQPKERPVPVKLLSDEQIGSRAVPLPATSEVSIHRTVPVPGVRKARGFRWPADSPDVLPLPDEVGKGDLLEVLEFVQVFAPEIGMDGVDLACFAAELLQPCVTNGQSVFANAECSVVGRVHHRMLDLLRLDVGDKRTIGSRGGWQTVMRRYLPVLTGEASSAAPSAGNDMQRHDSATSLGAPRPSMLTRRGAASQCPEGSQPAGTGTAVGCEVQELLPVYPTASSYWGLQPEQRLKLLQALVHASLDTFAIRSRIDEAMGEAAAVEKARREATMAAKKEARALLQAQRDREVAAMLVGAGPQAMSLEEQRQLMEQSRKKAEAAAGIPAAGAGRLRAGSGVTHAAAAAVGTVPVGFDADGRAYWRLTCGPVLTGAEKGVLVEWPSNSSRMPLQASSRNDLWASQACPQSLAAALRTRSATEAPLRDRLAAMFQLDVPALCQGQEPASTLDHHERKADAPMVGDSLPDTQGMADGSRRREAVAGPSSAMLVDGRAAVAHTHAAEPGQVGGQKLAAKKLGAKAAAGTKSKGKGQKAVDAQHNTEVSNTGAVKSASGASAEHAARGEQAAEAVQAVQEAATSKRRRV